MSQASTIAYTTNDMDEFSDKVAAVVGTLTAYLGGPGCLDITPVNILPDVLNTATLLIKRAVEENTVSAWDSLKEWFIEQFPEENPELVSISCQLEKMMAISEEHADTVTTVVVDFCDEILERDEEDDEA
jgi:hypothetical protein